MHRFMQRVWGCLRVFLPLNESGANSGRRTVIFWLKRHTAAADGRCGAATGDPLLNDEHKSGAHSRRHCPGTYWRYRGCAGDVIAQKMRRTAARFELMGTQRDIDNVSEKE